MSFPTQSGENEFSTQSGENEFSILACLISVPARLLGSTLEYRVEAGQRTDGGQPSSWGSAMAYYFMTTMWRKILEAARPHIVG